MHATEVVIGMVDGNHVAVVLKLFRECIREPSESPDAHSCDQFSHDSLPIGGGLGIYTDEAYAKWGIS